MINCLRDKIWFLVSNCQHDKKEVLVSAAKYVSDYPVFSVTADLVVLTIRDERLCVLLVKRGGAPFKGRLALPGGFVQAKRGHRAGRLP